MVRKSVMICVLMILLALSACGRAGENGAQQQVLALRRAYLEANGCTAALTVTADYGQRVYTYGAEVVVADGESVLTVTAPKELAGITARVTDGDSRLEYDGTVLETGPLSPDGLTPLGAVPALLDSARSGFVASCGVERLGDREYLRVLCRDPEQPAGQGQEVTLWFDRDSHTLVQGEIAEDGYRVILCEFKSFTLS